MDTKQKVKEIVENHTLMRLATVDGNGLPNVKVNKKCDWINLRAGKDYPWVIAGYASVVMDDKVNAEKFYDVITKKFIGKENEPHNLWNSFEAAWFIFMAERM